MHVGTLDKQQRSFQTPWKYEHQQQSNGNINSNRRQDSGLLYLTLRRKFLFSFLLLELTSLCKVVKHLGNSDSLDLKKNLKEILSEMPVSLVSDQPVSEDGPVLTSRSSSCPFFQKSKRACLLWLRRLCRGSHGESGTSGVGLPRDMAVGPTRLSISEPAGGDPAVC